MSPSSSSSSSPTILPSSSLLPALTLKPLSSHLYSATFPSEFCIGSVPHGGYISSTFLSAAQTHFTHTLSGQKQPDTIILSVNFLRRTNAGPALFRVRDVKLGRQTSIIHISLLQGDVERGWTASAEHENDAVEEAVAYITNTNLEAESGPSHATGWTVRPAIPTSDFSSGREGPGDQWSQVTSLPFAGFRKATSHIDLWIPRDGKGDRPKGRVDQWVRMRSRERWTNLHLGYLADYFPLLIAFMEPDTYARASAAAASNTSASSSAADKPSSTPPPAKNWYPTLTLNLDIKTRLPDEGVEWLQIVAQMRSVRNGRSDIELWILDAEGKLVAASTHVSLVVPVERNLGKRSDRRAGGKTSSNI